jgi:hypothetical protein
MISPEQLLESLKTQCNVAILISIDELIFAPVSSINLIENEIFVTCGHVHNVPLSYIYPEKHTGILVYQKQHVRLKEAKEDIAETFQFLRDNADEV